MLKYFLMSYPNRADHHMGPGNANPIYSFIDPELGAGYAAQGYFVWTKSQSGYPWDVKPFDKYYVYDRSTELLWVDPLSFKRFNQDMRLSPRCISTTASSTIKIPKSRSAYSFYKNCAVTQTADLGYVVNTISSPTTVNTGGPLGKVKTRKLTYQYACNSNYGNCAYKEVFSLGLNVGLYNWKYYVKQNGQWVQAQESVINNYLIGQSVPYFMCPNTYQ